MKRLFILIVLALTCTKAAADWAPVFRSGYWNGNVSLNGASIGSIYQQETSPGYQYGILPDFNRSIDAAYSQINETLNDKIRDAFTGEQASFGSGYLSGPINIKVSAPDSSGKRNISLTLTEYKFSFNAWGSKNGFNLSCLVWVTAPNLVVQFKYNPISQAVEAPAYYGNFSHSINCSVTGIGWLEVIGRIFVKWLLPGPGDLFKLAKVGAKVYEMHSAASKVNQQLGSVPPSPQNDTVADVTILKYSSPAVVRGVGYPWRIANVPVTTNLFTGRFTTNSSLSVYSLDFNKTEVWDYIWWCDRQSRSCMEP